MKAYIEQNRERFLEELFTLLRDAGKTVRDITLCHTYDEYLADNESARKSTVYTALIEDDEN